MTEKAPAEDVPRDWNTTLAKLEKQKYPPEQIEYIKQMSNELPLTRRELRSLVDESEAHMALPPELRARIMGAATNPASIIEDTSTPAAEDPTPVVLTPPAAAP